jgi:hypothetical protein
MKTGAEGNSFIVVSMYICTWPHLNAFKLLITPPMSYIAMPANDLIVPAADWSQPCLPRALLNTGSSPRLQDFRWSFECPVERDSLRPWGWTCILIPQSPLGDCCCTNESGAGESKRLLTTLMEGYKTIKGSRGNHKDHPKCVPVAHNPREIQGTDGTPAVMQVTFSALGVDIPYR